MGKREKGRESPEHSLQSSLDIPEGLAPGPLSSCRSPNLWMLKSFASNGII